MLRHTCLLFLRVRLVAVTQLAAAASDDSLSVFVGRYSGAIANRLPGIALDGMPIALALSRDGEDVTLSFGGLSFVFADDGSRFHLLERSDAPETAFEAGFLRLADGGAVAQYSRVDHDGARRDFRLLLFRKNDGALIATLLTASGPDALSLWGMGELHRLTPQ
jgi:hypothetical protein